MAISPVGCSQGSTCRSTRGSTASRSRTSSTTIPRTNEGDLPLSTFLRHRSLHPTVIWIRSQCCSRMSLTCSTSKISPACRGACRRAQGSQCESDRGRRSSVLRRFVAVDDPEDGIREVPSTVQEASSLIIEAGTSAAFPARSSSMLSSIDWWRAARSWSAKSSPSGARTSSTRDQLDDAIFRKVGPFPVAQ